MIIEFGTRVPLRQIGMSRHQGLTDRLFLWWAALSATAIVGIVFCGCLPEPRPAMGKHLAVERGIEYITLSRATDGEAGDDAVYTKQKLMPPPIPPEGGLVGYPADLWAVNTKDGARRLLAEDIQPLLFAPFAWDARRRLLVERRMPSSLAPSLPFTVFAVDVTNGQMDDLGGDDTVSGTVSPSAWWTLTIRETPAPHWWAVSAEGHAVDLGEPSRYLQFVGDQIYVKNASEELIRIDAQGVMTVVADGIPDTDSWQLFALSVGDLVILFRASGVVEWKLIGSANAGNIIGKDLYAWRSSRDGSQLGYTATTADGKSEARVLTPSAPPPREQVWELPPSRNAYSPNYLLVWRPNSDELWCLDNNQYPVVVKPGQAAVSSNRIAVGFRLVDASSPGSAPVIELNQLNDFSGDFFVDGGRWWVSRDPSAGGVVRLADASDPGGGTGIVLGEAGEQVTEIAVLETGKRLAVRMRRKDDLTPADLYTVDLSDGTKHLVATHVAQATYGTSRILARADASQSGDGSRLSIFDLSSGKESVIAENVAQLVVARPCAACLPLDSGARMLFTIQARFPFEQDGLWIGTLP